MASTQSWKLIIDNHSFSLKQSNSFGLPNDWDIKSLGKIMSIEVMVYVLTVIPWAFDNLKISQYSVGNPFIHTSDLRSLSGHIQLYKQTCIYSLLRMGDRLSNSISGWYQFDHLDTHQGVLELFADCP